MKEREVRGRRSEKAEEGVEDGGAGGVDVAVGLGLFGVHFGDDAAELGCMIGREAVNATAKALFADGANPVDGDLGVPSGAAHLEATAPAWVQAGGERADDHGVQKPVHLIAADYHDRSDHADFATHGGVEIGDVDAIAAGRFRHYSTPSATATSKSLQSSDSAAMAR